MLVIKIKIRYTEKKAWYSGFFCGGAMGRTVGIGIQDFGKIIKNNYFYIDKSSFIREWWESGDDVTLITRPRRFGKTLTMSMLEQFFSVEYAHRGDLFAGLSIWQDAKYRDIQGTYPVISLSFANIKEKNYEMTRKKICRMLVDLYAKFTFVRDDGRLTEQDKAFFDSVMTDMDDSIATLAIHQLSGFLNRYYGKKVIILLDEYDTPMQEAYVNGYWEEILSFTGTLFNNTFKTNPYLERAILTGITRISKESLFSDLNNLKVITMTTNKYASCFGFTEEEVFAAMDEYGMTEKEKAKQWYDGFSIGNYQDMYNPWSVINMLDDGTFKAYWANTSSNRLAGDLIRQGNEDIKVQFEELLSGRTIRCRINEEIIYNQLGQYEDAVWSLLLASGYMKIVEIRGRIYELALTNYETKYMFENLVLDWFAEDSSSYNGFVRSLIKGDLKAMNAYMTRVSKSMFSSFDGGNRPSDETHPERFYHGFVLGLLVDLADRYVVTSNRESGFGRYDVLMEPKSKEYDGIILEFKVHDPEDEKDLQETVQSALRQIEEKQYKQVLLDHGIEHDQIRSYGFAFEGKKVLIGEGE